MRLLCGDSDSILSDGGIDSGGDLYLYDCGRVHSGAIPMKEVLKEAELIELQDAELKEYLGFTYESIKTLEEKKRHDPEIARLRETLRKYQEDTYNLEIKKYRAYLKAARTVAKARGIQWRTPQES
jgi:pyruvate/2-oxoglutarate dehydrogenase complex dihydrolipoamide dehydrogenase (E3) component